MLADKARCQSVCTAPRVCNIIVHCTKPRPHLPKSWLRYRTVKAHLDTAPVVDDMLGALLNNVPTGGNTDGMFHTMSLIGSALALARRGLVDRLPLWEASFEL